MTLLKIKIGLLALFAVAGLPVVGQDLIARQAPIDRRLKAVDSVSIQKMIEREQKQVAANLYPNWNNKYAHQYNVELPDSFKIDLRDFCMPTPSRRITSNYGYRKAYRRVHRGLDIKVYTGDTIVSAFDGKVRIVRYDAGGYGKYVIIRHPNGLETIYGHLSAQLVKENEEVRAGQPIGLGGSTGLSSGSHLHFETRLLGVAINPALLFDFPNQDVTCDYYTYYKDSYGKQSDLASMRTAKESAAFGGGTDNSTSAASEVGGDHFYKIKKGETLYSVSKKVGVSVEQLCKINGFKKSKKLMPGQILRY